MPILNNLVRVTAKALPTMIAPGAHAVVDYITVASFLAGAVWFWRRNKRASIAALLGSGAAVAVNLLTDYPGGVRKVITFRKHRDLDFGIAAMTASLPEFLGFREEPERRFSRRKAL